MKFLQDKVLIVTEYYTFGNIPEGNLLQPVFRDGKMIVDYTLDEIRQRLNNGKF